MCLCSGDWSAHSLPTVFASSASFEIPAPLKRTAQGAPIEAAESMKFGDVSPLLPQIQKFNKAEERGCADAEQFRGTPHGAGCLIRRKNCVSRVFTSLGGTRPAVH